MSGYEDAFNQTIAKLIEDQRKLIDEVVTIEERWKTEDHTSVLRGDTEALLQDANEITEQATPIVIAQPVTSIGSSRLGWSLYELANARLNLTYLLLFGINHVSARQQGRVPGGPPDYIPGLYVEALLSDDAKRSVLKRLEDGRPGPEREMSDYDWAGLIINSARDAADAKLKGEAR